ncbi:MAG: hypothetical protein WCW27_02395 [Patescibacteria group bacterium]|jgi:hypothetical protein
MHKKTYLITGLVGLVTLIGAGCTTEQNTNLPVNTAPTNTNTTTPAPEESTTEPVSSLGEYKNSTYGFSLVFPTNWGAVQEKVESGSKIYKTVRLTAENDSARYIQIQIVKNEDKTDSAVIDYPQTYLTENSTYSYYYSGSGDYAGYPDMAEQNVNIQKEVNDIIQTFSLIE